MTLIACAKLAAHGGWMGDVSAGAPPSASDRRRVAGISAALFVVTFLVYWLGGPMQTAFDFQLSQANNIVHGHLDLVPEYTKNLNVLERVLFDGQGFCLPIDDPRAADNQQYTFDVPHTTDCRHYMQHSLGPALLLVPLAFLMGLTVNQTLISALLGALVAPIVWSITRRFTDHLPTQLALTALALFGTTLLYSAADGSVWHFAHVTAVLFTFASIWATVVRRNALLAGAFIGAAFMCRPSMILAGAFPLVAFSDQWLAAAPAAARGTWQRIRARVNLRPLVALAVGVAPFALLTLLLNYLRFGRPFESGYSYGEQVFETNLASTYEFGLFDPRYIGRHVQVFFEQMPRFAAAGAYVWPTWAGQAMWAVSPALLIGLFAHLRRYQRLALALILGLAAAMAFMVLLAAASDLNGANVTPDDVLFGLHLAPFWIAIAAAVTLAVTKRDRLVIACWAAIVPLALFDWMFAATGWAQFGYRYGLDFMPFLFLLVVLTVKRARWYHVALIAASILINVWGVLWILKFAPVQLFGWTWVGW
jgi:hypothetical protein